MSARAVRLHEIVDEPSDLESTFPHIEHMYTGKLSHYYYRRFDQAIDLACPRSSDRVLEVGGGTGIFTVTLSKLSDRVCFTDIATYNDFETVRALLDEAGLGSKVDVVSSDATQLSFGKNVFDKVYVMDVLEHVLHEKQAIDELQRVLKPGGKLVVASPVEIGIPVLVREGYRFLDGRRNNTESLSELIRAAVGRPSVLEERGHRGYDYRETVEYIQSEFTQTETHFCPVPGLGRVNPTVLTVASN
jgi:ubiquinone/menaquinone biosynthesis C-methylase UbiE